MKRKILSVMLTAVLFVSMAAATTAPVQALAAGGSNYAGKDCTTNLNASATINYLMSKYRDGSTWKLGGECWGYAEKINEFLAADNDTAYFTGLKNTQKNFFDKCLGVMAGTHVRFSNDKNFNDWVGHSVVLLKVTEDKIYWTDNNYDRANTVHYYSGSIDDFWSLYGQYSYLNMVKQPTKYKTYTKPKISSRADSAAGGIRLTWLRTTYTDEYQVYRSYSKNGPYKKIASLTGKTFLDKDVQVGVSAYYKVKSVRTSGITASGYVTNRLKLAAPVISVTNDENRRLYVSWSKVEGADRYKVYRRVNGGAEKLVKTTEALSYTDTGAKEGSVYEYRVKAICDANSGGNSSYSEAAKGSLGLATPTGLSGTTDSNNYLTLTWNPVKGAEAYYLYCCREANGTYWLEAEITGATSYFDSVRLPGQKYYYKIAAYDRDTGEVSLPSSWILI